MRPLLDFRGIATLVMLGATVTVLCRILLVPSPIERPPIPVILPSESPLPGWDVTAIDPSPALPNTRRFHQSKRNPAIDLELQFIPNLPEHYVRNPRLALRFLPHGHLPLDAGMHYYVNSRTMVITNLDSNIPIRETVAARETSPRSAYGIWSAGERIHLSTIITADGDSSMATRRVARSMYLDHLTAGRLWGWLRGLTTIPDRRCVLVHFSSPTAASPPDANRSRLEEAWSEWQRAFRPVFLE